MLQEIARYIIDESGPDRDVTGKKSIPVDLVTLVKQDAQRYCSKDEAIGVLDKLASQVESWRPMEQIEKLYKQDVLLLDKIDLPNKVSIAKWLKNNKNEYFINIVYRSEEYRGYEFVPKKPTPLPGLGFALTSLYPTSTEAVEVTKTRQIIDGFDHSTETPYKAIRIDERPTLENLVWWSAFIVPIFSKVTIRVFYCFVASIEKNWGEWEMPDKVAWQTQEMDMKGEGLEFAVEEILKKFDDAILTSLKERFKNVEIKIFNVKEDPEKPLGHADGQ